MFQLKCYQLQSTHLSQTLVNVTLSQSSTKTSCVFKLWLIYVIVYYWHVAYVYESCTNYQSCTKQPENFKGSNFQRFLGFCLTSKIQSSKFFKSRTDIAIYSLLSQFSNYHLHACTHAIISVEYLYSQQLISAQLKQCMVTQDQLLIISSYC